MNVRHLSTHNTKGFFSGMKEGDQFTYPRHNYSPDRIRKMAARAGLKVADCENQNAWNLARGWTQCAVTGKTTRDELEFEREPESNRSDTKEAYLAAAHLMTMNWLNTDEPADRAAFLIGHVLKGTLASHFRAEHARMKKREFEHYYGAPLQNLLLQARRLENLAGDDQGVNAATVIANAASGVCRFLAHNFAHLLAAGIPGEIGSWCDGFRGVIIRIDRVGSMNIVTTKHPEGGTRYYCDSDWTMSFREYEAALLNGMFGKEHLNTVLALYRAVNEKKG